MERLAVGVSGMGLAMRGLAVGGFEADDRWVLSRPSLPLRPQHASRQLGKEQTISNLGITDDDDDCNDDVNHKTMIKHFVGDKRRKGGSFYSVESFAYDDDDDDDGDDDGDDN